MFNGVHFWWPIRLVFPALKVHVVAHRIVSMASDDDGVHHAETMPLHIHWCLLLASMMPTFVQDLVMETAGGRNGMDTWKPKSE
mmetsp:Transcript_401/g.591  ORF Transcript_401/g.591 Transcript_401/m.591 type:complete len:84 (+) Transcript_401:1010-1261(+)